MEGSRIMEIINVSNISKSFRIHLDKPTTLKEKFLFMRNSKYEDFWALRNISLSINKGDTVGLIGRNGSGKSTLLKILTKIIYPTSGTVNLQGRISSLLELGAGFHPDFTGRENIFMNASILGMARKEIESKLSDIIAFSELGEFIERPVRTYSSGMYMRLAFSIAINVEPEILLIDEILAVGDAAFQDKCLSKIMEMKNNGVTIVIVAHDNGIIKKLCNKVVWIQNGEVMDIGDTESITEAYEATFRTTESIDLDMESNLDTDLDTDSDVNPDPDADIEIDLDPISHLDTQPDMDIVLATDPPTEELDMTENVQQEEMSLIIQDPIIDFEEQAIQIQSVLLNDEDGIERETFMTGKSMRISIHYKIIKDLDHVVVFGLGFYRLDYICCYGSNTLIDHQATDELPNEGVIHCIFKDLQLLRGDYVLNIDVHKDTGETHDFRRNIPFRVETETIELGIARQPHEWEIATI
jgi:ABC-type polysaccharide/polyol phosphate transport system ATPase subunit